MAYCTDEKMEVHKAQVSGPSHVAVLNHVYVTLRACPKDAPTVSVVALKFMSVLVCMHVLDQQCSAFVTNTIFTSISPTSWAQSPAMGKGTRSSSVLGLR
jgi:hypothetical protein